LKTTKPVYTSSSDTDRKIVIHAHFGGRVNSVLAILFQHSLDNIVRCKAYTSYTDDAVLIHFYGLSDELSDVFSLVSSKNVEQVLIKMLPNTSRFSLTFRYNAYRALMMGIRKTGQRLPLWIQRLRSVDALENAQKYIDHPLIIETMRECLEYIFDIPNTIRVLEKIEQGEIQVVEKSTWFPSPFASEILFEFQQDFLYMEKAAHPGYGDKSAISSIDALNLSFRTEIKNKKLRKDALSKVVQSSNSLYKLSDVHSANELQKVIFLAEKYGERLSFSGALDSNSNDSDILLKSVMAFTEAFKQKRIWHERKKITVKYWPEDTELKEQLISALTQAGFLPELDRMVLWRSH
jgi:ATP-dependent Lhr-like helicase